MLAGIGTYLVTMIQFFQQESTAQAIGKDNTTNTV